MIRRSPDSFVAGSGKLHSSVDTLLAGAFARLKRVASVRTKTQNSAVYVTACCGEDIRGWAREAWALGGGSPIAADLHVAKMAKHSIQLEHAVDLSEILPDFAFHLEMLKRLAAQGSNVGADVDRHPVIFLYARRAAELAGVKICEHETVTATAERARVWCERAAQGSTW